MTKKIVSYTYKGEKIPISCVGNSLDNHKAEYFFSNIKSACLNHMQTSKMIINKIKVKVAKYIKWSNYNWIQSRLKWKTPALAKLNNSL